MKEPGGRPEEALTFKGVVSPPPGRPYTLYPMTWICGVFRIPRSTVYAHLGTVSGEARARTVVSDERLLEEIRRVTRKSSFHGEGHRKVTARVRGRGF